MSELKAYHITSKAHDGGLVVFATNCGKAKTCAGKDYDWCFDDFVDLRASRVPEFDALAPGPLLPADYLSVGWNYGCGKCDYQVYPDEPYRVDKKTGRVYHRECYRRLENGY